MKVVINNADQPTNRSLNKVLIKIMQHRFNFQKKITQNVEGLKTEMTHLESLGIEITAPQVVTIILSNVEGTTKHEWG